MIDKPDIFAVMEREGIELKHGKALCPFHDERTPSFTVSGKRQRFHCFGCGESGDVIDFIKKLHNLSFKDAISYLGVRPGHPVQINQAIQRRRSIQQSYEKAINKVYSRLCDRARHLNGILLQVKNNPSTLTDAGAVLFAEQMGELAAIDHKLDILLTGTFEDQMLILKGAGRNDSANFISRAA